MDNLIGAYTVDVITTKQATQNLEQLIEHVILDVEPTIIYNDNGQRTVLMALDEFNAWQETFYLLSNPANAAHNFKSIQEISSLDGA
jgi:antitoxin YefM